MIDTVVIGAVDVGSMANPPATKRSFGRVRLRCKYCVHPWVGLNNPADQIRAQINARDTGLYNQMTTMLTAANLRHTGRLRSRLWREVNF